MAKPRVQRIMPKWTPRRIEYAYNWEEQDEHGNNHINITFQQEYINMLAICSHISEASIPVWLYLAFLGSFALFSASTFPEAFHALQVLGFWRSPWLCWRLITDTDCCFRIFKSVVENKFWNLLVGLDAENVQASFLFIFSSLFGVCNMQPRSTRLQKCS